MLNFKSIIMRCGEIGRRKQRFVGSGRAFSLLLLLLIAASSRAADLRGDWVFVPTTDIPEFTVLSVSAGEPLRGSIRSRWYGDLPLLNLQQRDAQLVFNIDNGNPRLEKQDLVATPEGVGMRLTGRLWHWNVNVVAHRPMPGELAALAFPIYPTEALRDLPENGLARTPPMGWSSWNHFAKNIDDRTVREIADALVAKGLKEAGYIYVNIDDGWQGVRGADGVLQPNAKFPDMKSLADYLHAKGLKLGIYSSPGPRTCAGFTGSYGHAARDAKTWAAWGVDYLKYDLCSGEAIYRNGTVVRAVYQEMGAALQSTGRAVVFGLCEYGRYEVGTWGRKVRGNLWRSSGDISDDYLTMAKIGFDQLAPAAYQGPGGWNDPDMLEVGNDGMTLEEYRSHMSQWALLSAPLILGNDLRSVTAEALSLIANPEVIAIDQDALGRQGARAQVHGEQEIWLKPLADGASAVGLYNRSAHDAEIIVDWKALGFGTHPQLRDLWKRADLERGGAQFRTALPAHGVVLLKVTPDSARSP